MFLSHDWLIFSSEFRLWGSSPENPNISQVWCSKCHSGCSRSVEDKESTIPIKLSTLRIRPKDAYTLWNFERSTASLVWRVSLLFTSTSDKQQWNSGKPGRTLQWRCNMRHFSTISEDIHWSSIAMKALCASYLSFSGKMQYQICGFYWHSTHKLHYFSYFLISMLICEFIAEMRKGCRAVFLMFDAFFSAKHPV